MRVRIEGHHLPGRRFATGDGVVRGNVHVAVQERSEPVGLVAGDAPTASWDLDVRVVPTDDGGVDFRGPVVHGRRGGRFLYLTWGDVDETHGFAMFRRAKLVLDRVDADLVRRAEAEERTLRATIDLTDTYGGPRCARVDAPALVWDLGDPVEGRKPTDR